MQALLLTWHPCLRAMLPPPHHELPTAPERPADIRQPEQGAAPIRQPCPPVGVSTVGLIVPHTQPYESLPFACCPTSGQGTRSLHSACQQPEGQRRDVALSCPATDNPCAMGAEVSGQGAQPLHSSLHPKTAATVLPGGFTQLQKGGAPSDRANLSEAPGDVNPDDWDHALQRSVFDQGLSDQDMRQRELLCRRQWSAKGVQ